MSAGKAALIAHLRSPHYYTTPEGQHRSTESAQSVAVMRRWRVDELKSAHARMHERIGVAIEEVYR